MELNSHTYIHRINTQIHKYTYIGVCGKQYWCTTDVWNVKHHSSPRPNKGTGHPCAFDARPGLSRRSWAVVSALPESAFRHLQPEEFPLVLPLAHARPLRCQIRKSIIACALHALVSVLIILVTFIYSHLQPILALFQGILDDFHSFHLEDLKLNHHSYCHCCDHRTANSSSHCLGHSHHRCHWKNLRLNSLGFQK